MSEGYELFTGRVLESRLAAGSGLCIFDLSKVFPVFRCWEDFLRRAKMIGVISALRSRGLTFAGPGDLLPLPQKSTANRHNIHVCVFPLRRHFAGWLGRF